MREKIIILLVFVMCIFCAGCTNDKAKENQMFVYYLNADGNGLVQEASNMIDIDDAINRLQGHNVLSQEVSIEQYSLTRSQLSLYFHAGYHTLSKSAEVLTRAAIVQTMTQFPEVEFVAFYVADEALRDSDGNVVGLMSAQDFVQNTGSSIGTYQTTDLILYFADKEGENLKEIKKTNIRYNANTAIEKLVVEQLMKGTSSSTSQSVIPKTTKLLGVSVKDGVCYVNFDSKFADDGYDLDPEIIIYSIVNSIVANGNVVKVQILIDGTSDFIYKNKVDLNRQLEWKKGLIKE